MNSRFVWHTNVVLDYLLARPESAVSWQLFEKCRGYGIPILVSSAQLPTLQVAFLSHTKQNATAVVPKTIELWLD